MPLHPHDEFLARQLHALYLLVFENIELVTEQIVPCGTCRQVLREFAPDIEVICLNGKGEARHFALKELLPESFGPEYL